MRQRNYNKQHQYRDQDRSFPDRSRNQGWRANAPEFSEDFDDGRSDFADEGTSYRGQSWDEGRIEFEPRRSQRDQGRWSASSSSSSGRRQYNPYGDGREFQDDRNYEGMRHGQGPRSQGDARALSGPLGYGQASTHGYGQERFGPDRSLQERGAGYSSAGYGDYRGSSSAGGDRSSFGSDMDSLYGRDQNQNRFYQQERSMTTYAGKGPKGYRRSDERIKEEVCDALEAAPHIDASEIEVDVKEGLVTLTGTVSSRQAKRAAEECVEHLSGVSDVTNNIRILAQQGQGGRASNQDQNAPTANSQKTQRETNKDQQQRDQSGTGSGNYASNQSTSNKSTSATGARH